MSHHRVCNECYDNAGKYLEDNAPLITLIPELLEACFAALELKCPDGAGHECPTIARINEIITEAEKRKRPPSRS